MATIEGAVFNQLNTVYKLFNYVLPRAVNATVLQVIKQLLGLQRI